jgi:Tol biopolymer transport system component
MWAVFRYAGGLLGGVALALACSGGATATAAPVPEGPRLAFTAMTSLQSSAFTVRTVGAESTKPLVLVRGSRRGIVPNPPAGVAWSADGSLLAFTGFEGRRKGIYTVRADGSGLRFLRGTRGGSNPVFSPDGRRIAFSREHLGKGFFFGTTPWVARVDGSRARRLAPWRDGVEYVPSSFSPDGSTLAVTRSEVFDPDRSAALLFKLDGRGGRRPLVRFPASEPVFSPDGSQVALVRLSVSRRRNVRSLHRDLFLVDASGANVRRLTDTRWIAETQPSWDPSGQRIAFSSFRINRDPFEAFFDELLPFGNSIVQINADGTCRTKLISLRDAGTFGPKWQPGQGREAGRIECGAEPANRAPAGPRLALVKFDLPSFRFELETVGESGGQPFHLAGGGEWRRPLPEWFTAPAWSPDGSKVVFAGVARRLFGGPRETRLYVSRADGKLLRPLRGTHGGNQPVFAPDGDTVAFARYRFQASRDRQGKEKFVPRGASIWLVDLDGGAPRRITAFRKGLYMYPTSFSPDGSTLLATREVGSRAPKAVALKLSTGRTRTVVQRAFDPIYSPDGGRIVFMRERSLARGNGDDNTTTDLFTIKADGGGLRRLTSGRKDDYFPSWDPSGKRIAFVRYRPEVTERDEIGIGSAIMEVNSDGSCLRGVLKPSRGTAFYGIAWQPGTGREAGRIVC